MRQRTGLPSVHPHARGERWPPTRTSTPAGGSSPRSWGTPPLTLPQVLPSRFIPTLVGNAAAIGLRLRASTVHPHARGERAPNPIHGDGDTGSSPRSWGTPVDAVLSGFEGRFIPTLVGNAQGIASDGIGRSVHPHARGERWPNAQVSGSPGGSSPRSWGTRVRALVFHRHHRFIPTLVGNARSTAASICSRPVHPHARGERRGHLLRLTAADGSSPRSWGTL